MFKLIAIDLDGTLLNDKKKIPLENIKYIDTLINKGYEVVIATGRIYSSAKELIKDINEPLTILANNGNVARRSCSDELIFAKYLDREDSFNIITLGKQWDLHPIIYVNYHEEGIDMIIEEKGFDADSSYFTNTRNRLKILSKEDILSIDNILAITYPGQMIKLQHFYDKLNYSYPDKFNHHILENISVAEGFYEIMNRGGNKWKSLMEYADSLNIKPSEIIAIGDDNNDLEMILNAGLGIAMKNGSELVKEASDVVTKYDNNNAGFAFELSKLLD